MEGEKAITWLLLVLCGRDSGLQQPLGPHPGSRVSLMGTTPSHLGAVLLGSPSSRKSVEAGGGEREGENGRERERGRLVLSLT